MIADTIKIECAEPTVDAMVKPKAVTMNQVLLKCSLRCSFVALDALRVEVGRMFVQMI